MINSNRTHLKQSGGLAQLLIERVENSPTTVGFRYLSDGEKTTKQITYGALLAAAAQVAYRLRAEQGYGQTAIVLGLSGLEYIVSLFACFLNGTIAVPVAPLHPNRKSQAPYSIIRSCGAKFVLGSREQLDLFQQSAAHLSLLSTLVHVNVIISDEITPPSSEFPVTPHSIAYLQYTSGSTETPRGAVITHEAVLANIQMISEAFEHPAGRSVVSWLPLFHDMGLITNVLAPLYIKAPSVFMSPFGFLKRPLRWLEAIDRYDAASSGAPNFAYELCAKRAPRREDIELDLSRWNLAFCGSEPIRVESLTGFAESYSEFGFKKEAFYPCYGLAEATLFVCGGKARQGASFGSFDGDSLSEGRAKGSVNGERANLLVSCGWPRGDLEVLIVNPTTKRPCIPGRIGEIWLRGSNLASGYWKDIRKTREIFGAILADGRGPYLRTGDLGFQWEGQIYISGRDKDLIIIDGRNYYPSDIENVVEKSNSAIRPCGAAAFSVDRAGKEEAVVIAEITSKTVRKLGLDTTMDNSCASLPEPLRPIVASVRNSVWKCCELNLGAIAIALSGSIPRTTSGKIQRSRCRQKYLDGSWSWIDQSRISRLRKAPPSISKFGPSMRTSI